MKKSFFVKYFVVAIFVVLSAWQVSAKEHLETDLIPMKLYMNRYGIPGYVWFQGFDFLGYNHETDPEIEKFLEWTLKELQREYDDGHPFVFVGHSQGGLRVLAMSSYLREKDPKLYKQLKGVITLSGIDRGLKLLENYGGAFRYKFYKDIFTLSNGMNAMLYDIDAKFLNKSTHKFLERHRDTLDAESVWSLVDVLLTGTLLTKEFSTPAVEGTQTRFWDDYAQVRDMVMQSEIVKKYVLEETDVYFKYNSKKDIAVEWHENGAGEKHPTVEMKSVPQLIKAKKINMKVDPNLPLYFCIGTESSLSGLMGSDILVKDVHDAGDYMSDAQAIHLVKSVGLAGLMNGNHLAAIDASKAADWCHNMEREFSRLLGDAVHDGLVAKENQYLPKFSVDENKNMTQILSNTTIKEFPYNHIGIAEKDSDSIEYSRQLVKQILGIE